MDRRFGYGYFIDELYYIACARRLDFGFVDHPPLAPAILRLTMALSRRLARGDPASSALAGALTVLATGWLAARLGAGRFGQALASLCAVVPPVFLVLFNVFSMNSFEILLWTALLIVAVVLVERNEPRLWVVFGALAGIALENKHTVVLLALGIVVGLVLTRERRLLFTRWLFVGGVVAFVLFLPNLLWQIDNEFPSLEFYRNATLLKNRPLPPLQVVWNQILFMGPWTFPVWAAGLYFCLAPQGHRSDFSRSPTSSFWGRSSSPSRVGRTAWRDSIPRSSPAVPCNRKSRPFAERPRARPRRSSRGQRRSSARSRFPSFLPRAFRASSPFSGSIPRSSGARESERSCRSGSRTASAGRRLVDQVAGVYLTLPENEKARAVILAPSYGHAGALELFGKGRLPPVLSQQNTYHLWGRDELQRLEGGVLISIGDDSDDLDEMYESVVQVAVPTATTA